MGEFAGFPKGTGQFPAGVTANNDKAWFESNRHLFEAGYVEPGRAFVSAMGPRLRTISPTVQFEPRVNGSISRINRDIRFSKDKRPYKDHLDLWFWHGERRGWDCPGFWFRLTAENVYLGTGMHGFQKERLDSFRHAVVLPRSGQALVRAVEEVKAAGPYEIGEKTRKSPPRGFEVDADRAEYLLYEGLTAGIQLPAEAAMEADFLDVCFKHFSATWPVGKWLLEEIA